MKILRPELPYIDCLRQVIQHTLSAVAYCHSKGVGCWELSELWLVESEVGV